MLENGLAALRIVRHSPEWWAVAALLDEIVEETRQNVENEPEEWKIRQYQGKIAGIRQILKYFDDLDLLITTASTRENRNDDPGSKE